MSGLDAKGLTTSYGNVEVLHGITLSVSDGAGIGVLGPNGAGKTTLLRSFTQAFGVTVRGQMLLDDTDLTRLRTDAIARMGVSLVPAERRVFPVSVADNFALACPKGVDVVKEVGTFIEYFPFLEPLLSRRGDLLSGGEQQAVAIVRGCLSKPRFLLLDEPTEGLAPRAVEGIVALLSYVSTTLGSTLVIAESGTELFDELGLRTVALERGALA